MLSLETVFVRSFDICHSCHMAEVKESVHDRGMALVKLLAKSRCQSQSRHDVEAEAVVEKSQSHVLAWEKAILVDLWRPVFAARALLMEGCAGYTWVPAVLVESQVSLPEASILV
jgi:hypothetical protein